MDVKTFNEIYVEVAVIQKYFVKIFDMNVFTIWASRDADRKYKDLLKAVEDCRTLKAALREFEDTYVLEDGIANVIDRIMDIICKAVFDEDISGYKHAHQIFEAGSKLAEYRVDATAAARRIAGIVGIDEDEMINGLD